MNRSALPLRLRAGTIVGIVAGLIIAGYALFAMLPYLLGPSLTASAVTENGITTVIGRTERVSYLSIDGMPVPLEVDGSFSAKRAYPLGYTAITVSATDRFGRTIIRTVTFLHI